MEGDQQLRPPRATPAERAQATGLRRLRPSLSTASDSILVALVGNTENGSIIGTSSNS